MCDKSWNDASERIADRLRNAGSILVLTHMHPDGDALGSMSALAGAAQAVGKRVCLLVPEDFPQQYGYLLDDLSIAAPDRLSELSEKHDLIVVVDTCAFSQLVGLEEALTNLRKKIIVIDHHATNDDLGSERWIDTSASAAGVMIGRLLAKLDWPVTAYVAEAMATAMLTDTGWLRFSNTNPEALRMMADWVAAGVRMEVLYRRIFQADRPERLRLMGRAMERLELFGNDQLAVMTIRKEDFQQTGANQNETENLINESLRIKTVEAAVIFVEQEGQVRVSLRSRGMVNVAEVAKRFGGGGHVRAAGFRTSEPLDEIKLKLISFFQEALCG